jgi:hypothetical protein
MDLALQVFEFSMGLTVDLDILRLTAAEIELERALRDPLF